jgi:isocitrate dehydrogenase kinase/phosphatase
VTRAPSPSPSHTASTVARLLAETFAEYHDAFREAGRAAAHRFASRDWHGARRTAADRLDLYPAFVARARALVERDAGDRIHDRDFWRALRDRFAEHTADRPDREIAQTFFNSLTRNRLATIGVDDEIEFVFAERRRLPRTPLEAPVRWCPVADRPDLRDASPTLVPLARRILDLIPHPIDDVDGDAALVAAALARAAADDHLPPDAITGAELLRPIFYRNKGAYLVGRLRAGERQLPLALALLDGPRGVYVDAVLTTADELSVVFGFSWSYFLADIECPGAVVAFLASLMPRKRPEELYTAIGYSKHGKTELFRGLLHHLDQPDARFEEAEGSRGLVMTVFTLPSLDVVFKLIRDDIAPPKRTTRREVKEKYRFVFVRDRVGRLADAQEFERLELPRRCFPEALLADLLRTAPTNVTADGDRVVVRHVYTQRRLRPLNLFLREAPEHDVLAAVSDYGRAIRELAAADIFTGDMLTKNCGVSRHGRVIFYDFDELSTLGGCHFRRIPPPRDLDDELAAEPWYPVGEHDVFPEQFAPFLVPPGASGEAFLAEHRDLLDPDWWRSVQERLAAGELFDTFPYPDGKRLRRDR